MFVAPKKKFLIKKRFSRSFKTFICDEINIKFSTDDISIWDF